MAAPLKCRCGVAFETWAPPGTVRQCLSCLDEDIERLTSRPIPSEPKRAVKFSPRLLKWNRKVRRTSSFWKHAIRMTTEQREFHGLWSRRQHYRGMRHSPMNCDCCRAGEPGNLLVACKICASQLSTREQRLAFVQALAVEQAQVKERLANERLTSDRLS